MNTICKGTLFALAACFIWGFIFVIPQFMEGFSSLEIVLGRYLCYGTLSLLLFKWNNKYSYGVWIKALACSLVSTIVYYTSVVIALRYATPSMCALILGISPITIAFYGNWRQKECSFKRLILPSVMILLGLILINAPHLTTTDSSFQYSLGLIFSLLALMSWSFYVVANSQFLKTHPTITSNEWSTLLGVAALFWAGVCTLFMSMLFPSQLEINKYFLLTPSLIHFVVGCSILGVVCSWLGAYLWNQASLRLPVSLAGQLTIFETIFGLIFVYILELRVPPAMESIGIILLLSSIIYGIRSSAKMTPQHAIA